MRSELLASVAATIALASAGNGTASTQTAPAIAAAPADPLLDQFRDPPASARPRTWWHWLNGNITEDGITKDLEWMHRAGLGGVQAFDASLGTPQLVAHPLPYMSPEWKAAFAHAAATAKRLDLELGIAASPGWSETGGPWVPPADAMKKLSWNETEVEGGRAVAAPLAPAPGVTGPYGWTPYSDPIAGLTGAAPTPPQQGGDVAVFAYPVTDEPREPLPTAEDVTGGKLDAARLFDAREDSVVVVPRGTAERPAAVTLAYASPRTIRSATLFVPHAVPPFGLPPFRPQLEAEVAGRWQAIAPVPLGNVPTTVAFAPVRARRFRLVFAAPPPAGAPDLPPAPGAVVAGGLPSGPADSPIEVGTLRLSSAARIDRFEAKAGFQSVLDYYALATTATDTVGIAPERVVDLTDRLRPDGTLAWTPPRGRWRVVRLGWSLLGTTNHPAAAASTGLEVDKYDGAAVRRYLTTYLDTYRDVLGPTRGVGALVTDSIEAGDANWTPRLFAEFRALRGYDPRPWLPALTGAVVGSRARSDAFLYDYRRTLADLLAREHYGTVATVAHEHGLTLYGEALEDKRPQLGDDIAMRAHADVPMAAMWAFPADGTPRPTLMGDILGAASVAHVYGRTFVAAESFTSAFAPWAYAPADLRRVADLEFALGVNRPVIHTSPMSPMDDREPGLSLAIFGQYFNRHESWAEMARPWVDYLARSSLLLQQGRHVADVAWFTGEEAPLTALFASAVPADLPRGHGFDFVDADVLANELSVEGGAIVARGGARYRLLYLGGTSRRMTLPTLRRVAALVEAGATVVGEAPVASPSLADDPAAFAALVARLWHGTGETRVGAGRVIAGNDPSAALAQVGVARDVDLPGIDTGAVLFQHRTLPGADIYYIVNRARTPLVADARFRVAGRLPELWHADSGTSESLGYRTDGAATVVPLTLAPQGSVFVLFRRSASAAAASVVAAMPRPVATVADTAWRVTFQSKRGAPAGITLRALAPLQTQADPGVRYFSGVATYTTRFTLSADAARRARWIDLGRVGDVAEVRVNGRPLGAAWHAPYRIDLAGAARRGANTLEVRVANLWVNRLIGDAQPGAAKVTFVAAPTYRPDAPLRPAGLIGPVTLLNDGGAVKDRRGR